MPMTPEIKDRLMRYTLVAKQIIYDKPRMEGFLKMLGTKDGAITAVQTVMGVIENQKPIPAEVAPLLGVNIYMLLVDAAQAITGRSPNPDILKEVIFKIMKSVKPTAQETPGAQPSPQPPGQPAMQPPAQPGLINQPAGA